MLLAVFSIISAIVILRNGLISNARTIGIDNDIFRATLGFGVGVILFRISGSLERIRAAKPICDAIALTSISCFLYYCAKSPLSNTSDLAMMLICFPLLIVSATRGTRQNCSGFLRSYSSEPFHILSIWCISPAARHAYYRCSVRTRAAICQQGSIRRLHGSNRLRVVDNISLN